jgi:hypothetical protein
MLLSPWTLKALSYSFEVKPTIHFLSISARKIAEIYVRSRLPALAHVPNLYGISAIGRNLSYYTYHKDSGVIEPAALPDNPHVVLDTAPVERWDTNIMQEEVRTKFLAMVEEIKQMVRDMWYVLVYSSV